MKLAWLTQIGLIGINLAKHRIANGLRALQFSTCFASNWLRQAELGLRVHSALRVLQCIGACENTTITLPNAPRVDRWLLIFSAAVCITSCNGLSENQVLGEKPNNSSTLQKRHSVNPVVALPLISKNPQENKLNAEKCVALASSLINRGVIDNGTDPTYYRSAKVWLDRSIALLPNATAYAYRGNLYSLLGDKQKSIGDFEQAFKLGPDQFANYVIYGNALMRFEMYEQAIQAYSKFLEKVQKQTNVWLLRGIAYYKNKQYQQASKDLLRACKETPESPEPRLYLGLTQRAMGLKLEAIGTLLEAEMLYQKLSHESTNLRELHQRIIKALMQF